MLPRPETQDFPPVFRDCAKTKTQFFHIQEAEDEKRYRQWVQVVARFWLFL